MRKTLLATTALAFAGAMAAGSASAADKMSVGVHGYMEQWVGMSDVDNSGTKEGAVEVRSDAEIHFRGTLKADNGLTFTVDIQLEGNNQDNQKDADKNSTDVSSMIDESFLKITGDFGDLRIGSEDAASILTHFGHQDVGSGFDAGDVNAWLGFGGPTTGGTGTGYHSDQLRVVYFTPRMNGVQLAGDYMPSKSDQAKGGNSPDNNDEDAWSAGVNYKGAIGDSSVAVSLGHHSQSTVGGDDATYTNFGLRVGVGMFGFSVAYGEADDGVKGDSAKDHETVIVGAKYADGPVAVSVGFATKDPGVGEETDSAILSAAYTLAPGVAWKSSLFSAEKGDAEGTAFVTGVTVGF